MKSKTIPGLDRTRIVKKHAQQSERRLLLERGQRQVELLHLDRCEVVLVDQAANEVAEKQFFEIVDRLLLVLRRDEMRRERRRRRSNHTTWISQCFNEQHIACWRESHAVSICHANAKRAAIPCPTRPSKS